MAAERPCIENLNFNMLNVGQCGELTKPFSVEEVKKVVWDCDSFESPGPNVVNSLLRIFGRSSVMILCDSYLIFIGMGSCQKASTLLLLL